MEYNVRGKHIYDSARVFDSALVFGSARVSGSASVYGSAEVYGEARVYGSAEVYGEARVYGEAEVSGSAEVSGNTRIKLGRVTKGHIKDATEILQAHIGYDIVLTRYEINIGCRSYTWENWRGETDFDNLTEGQVKMIKLFILSGANYFGIDTAGGL